MSHLHIPDGILPLPLWLGGFVALALVLVGSLRLGAPPGAQRIAYQAGLGGLMLAVMAIPVPISGFDYCMTLAGPVGVLLGARGAIQVSFIVTVILALMGQGGWTVIGLNALIMGLGATTARPVYGALAPRWGAGVGMAVATAVSQALSSVGWLLVLLASVRLHAGVSANEHVMESIAWLRSGALAAVLLPLLALAVAIESLLGAGIGRFLGRVRPDLLPGAAPGPHPGA